MRKKFNLVVLSDNRSRDETLTAEHGLCIFLDTGKMKLLMDTGASDLFVRNAHELEVDLKAVDLVFISHGHRDHMGGLSSFLELNEHAKVVLSPKIRNRLFISTRNGIKRNIGPDFDWERFQDRMIWIEHPTVLNEEIFVFPCNSRDCALPKADQALYRNEGFGFIQDDFDHELILGIGSEDVVIYSGCAHNGLINILKSFVTHTNERPGVVVGGFHLLDSKPGQTFESEVEINQIGEVLKLAYPETNFITGHCTGSEVSQILKHQLGQHIDFFYTGYQNQI